MEKNITLSELKNVVKSAYDKFKTVDEGEVDSRNISANPDSLGIAVTLTDGTMVTLGDADVKAPLGSMLRLPLSSILFSQNSVSELIKKCGQCVGRCNGDKPQKPHTGVGAHGVRAMSAVQPTGDADSKWNFVVDRIISMTGSEPILDDRLYEKMKSELLTDKTVNAFADASFYLYDDTESSIDLYLRGKSMTVSASQLASMGATVIAGGVNPVTKKVVFDSEISPRLVAMMAVKGINKKNKGWLILTGLPALSSFGGMVLGVVPGVMSISVYSPKVDQAGVSVAGQRILAYIMDSLKINAFTGDHVVVDKDK